MGKCASLLLLGCCAWGASAAHAQSAPAPGYGPPAPRDMVTLGLGIGVTTDYDGGRAYRIIPGGALLGTIQRHDFRLNGLQVFVDAIPNAPRRKIDIEFGPIIGLALNRTGDVDDPRVAALGQLKTGVELGLHGAIGVRGLRARSDKLSFGVTSKWDVAGAHRSHVISPSIDYSFVINRRSFVRMALTSEFVGKGWAVYNFGIDAAGAAASGLRIHTPDGGLASLGTSLQGVHALSTNASGWALVGIVNYKRLQGDIAASPIVRDTGSANQFFGSVALAYRF